MGAYSIKVRGKLVGVNVIDDICLVERYVMELTKYAHSDVDTQVVGIDIKTFKHMPSILLLILVTGAHCLIIYLKHNKNECTYVPPSISDLLNDEKICFVKGVDVHLKSDLNVTEVGELAARVLKEPGLKTMSLTGIAMEAGVVYEGPTGGVGREIELNKNNCRVLSEEQVGVAVSDALAYYEIGYEMLNSVKPLDYLLPNGKRTRDGGWSRIFGYFAGH